MKKRSFGIDVLKVIAVLSVLTVHFFLNTKYYSTENFGINMKIQIIIRNFCMICVPLFMTITGYLNKEKEYNKSFFKKIINILIIWLFYSVMEFLILNIKNNTLSAFNFKNLLLYVSRFEACGYSWYVNMYIGLFLISPFINITFEAFDKKNRNITLILTIIMFILPTTFNRIFTDLVVLPDWWIGAYPIAYYVLGKYIYYEKPKFNKKHLVVLLVFLQIMVYSLSVLYSLWSFNDIFIYASAFIVFILFYDVDIKPKFTKTAIEYLSIISFDIYLASSLIDKLIYPFYYEVFGFSELKQNIILFYSPIILITVFALSIIYATIRKKLISIR